MKERTILYGAVTATAIVAVTALYRGMPSGAVTPAARVAIVALTPGDAVILVDGKALPHPEGSMDLRGSLGAVFVVDAAANGVHIVQRIAITEVGALPAQIIVPGAAPLAAPAIAPPPVVAAPTVAPRIVAEPLPTTTPAISPVARTPPAPPAAASGEVGFLNITAFPSAKVSEAGRVLCTTPCSHVPLSPGVHQLVLADPEQGLKTTVAVTIRSGETSAKGVSLERPTKPKLNVLPDLL